MLMSLLYLHYKQKEKIVEIDENTQLLKDLDETCPIHSQDGLAPFPLQGRIFLEQFGLFVRNEDEEEEGATAGGIAA